MKRRRYLVLAAAATTGLAGCAGDAPAPAAADDPETVADSPTATSTSTSSRTATESATDSPADQSSATQTQTASDDFAAKLSFVDCEGFHVDAAGDYTVNLFFEDAAQQFDGVYTEPRTFRGTGEHDGKPIVEAEVLKGEDRYHLENPDVERCTATPTPSPTPTATPAASDDFDVEIVVDEYADPYEVAVEAWNHNEYRVRFSISVTFYHVERAGDPDYHSDDEEHSETQHSDTSSLPPDHGFTRRYEHDQPVDTHDVEWSVERV